MQVAVERRPGSLVALTVTVESSVVQQRVEELFQKHARRVKVPGFRPGKAPRKILEEYINRNALLEDAIEDVINATYRDALREQHIEPLERGEIEDSKITEDNGLIYTVVVAVRPEITLPAYTGLTVRYMPTEVTDDQVAAEIERIRTQTAEVAAITEEGIQTGDYVTIDYTMVVDGAPYPEGDTTGYPLEVGTDTFFPELNDGLLGVKQGETVTISHTYPEEYSTTELAGKTADFQLTVQDVHRRILPEPTDAWAQLISRGSVTSLEELRNLIKENLQSYAKQADQDYIRRDLMRQIINGTELDLPDTLVNDEYEHLMEDLERRLARERLTLDEYVEMTNTTVEAVERERNLLARDLVRRALVLQEIARREKIFVTDDEVNTAIAMELYVHGEHDPQDVQAEARKLRKEYEKSGQLENIANRIFQEKVYQFLESKAELIAEGQQASSGDETSTAPPAEENGE